MKVEAVVLANGEYPTAPLPLQILADAPYVVCCDGGADEYIRNGHTPNLIIGDGDSISEENRKRYGHLLHRIAEQETNDQTKAVNYLLSQGKRRRRHRQTRRPYVGKHQPAYGLYACRSRCAYLHRPWHLYPLPEHMYFYLPTGTASIHHQLQCPQIAWTRLGIPSQRLHQLVAGHSQRMHRNRVYD